MSIILRTTSTAGHRVIRFIGEFQWTLLGLVVVTVGIVSMFIAIPYPVLVAEAVFSVTLLVLEIRKNIREARQTRFLPRPNEHFEDVVERFAGNGNFRVLDAGSGIFVHDRSASERMRSSEQFVQLSNHRYVVPRQLQPQARRFLKYALTNYPGRFNGPCIGWNTNLSDPAWPDGDIEVVVGDHFRFVQSDELATWDVELEDRVLPEFGRSLFIQRGGIIRDFRDSWLFNLIGASTVAITTDGRLVGTQQSAANLASQNLLAPSGSGSAEPKDFRGAHRLTLSQLAINAATRELSEEAGLGPNEMESSYLLGYGRWLDKAARGELLCVTFLNIDSHAVKQKRIHRAERKYTARSTSIRFAQRPTEWSPATPADMLPPGHRARMSVPLGAALSLLAEQVGLADSPVRERLLQLPVGP
jgi:8-oxo-dGTP pyrophosphatase MutT (NUDIX family)